jgi:hypothetical protein
MLEHIRSAHAPETKGRYLYRGCSPDCQTMEGVWLNAADFEEHLKRHHPQLAEDEYAVYAILRQ